VPTPVWGRDELNAGEGWNSNSMIAWLIARAGLRAATLQPPPHGRAPGRQAGLEVARRHEVLGRANYDPGPRKTTETAPPLHRIAGWLIPRHSSHFSSQWPGAIMRRETDTPRDAAEYVIGGALFFAVSTVTAAVMAIGFVVLSPVERLRP